MDNEETIKRIQKLVPSFMALEFGCEVIWHNPYHDKDELFKINTIKYHNKKEFTVMMTPITKSAIRDIEDTYKFDERILGKEFKILGKPITLSTVLLAVKTLECKKCNGQGGHLVNGGYSECGDCGGDKYDLPEDFTGTEFELGDILDFWNLSKDNFNDQSKETKIFIGELLVDKE